VPAAAPVHGSPRPGEYRSFITPDTLRGTMYRSITQYRIAPIALCAALCGCAATRPVAYSQLASTPELRSAPERRDYRTPYRYDTDVDWKKYTRLIIEPVAVYSGPDGQFEKVSEADRDVLARYMQKQFAEKLGTRWRIAERPAPGTLRLRLTLTGAKSSTPVLSTFTRFDLAGGPYNVVQGIRGREGSLTGSVSYAVELYDASTDRLLQAYVTKQYPNAMNVKASLGSLGASLTGIRIGADELAAQLN
jgi:hypothetical protein